MNRYDPDYSYWDSKEFKAYKAIVNAIVQSSKEPITLRAIREQIGDVEDARWTRDAIDLLTDKTIQANGVLRITYSPYRPEPRKPFIIDGNKQTEWNRYQAKLSRTYPTAAIGVNV